MQIRIDWNKLDWNEVEEFFYKAMLAAGYPSEHPLVQKLDNGFRKITHRERKLMLEDVWTYTPGSPYSAGMTTIFYEVGGELAPVRVPIWIMHYSGFYHGKAATHCLKKILRGAYQNPGESLGCRGPMEFQEAGYKYTNKLETSSDKFTYFAGWEELWDIAGNHLAGRHFYRGTALV